MLGQQLLDTVVVGLQQAGAPCRPGRRGLRLLQGCSHRVSRAVQTPRDGPAGEFVDHRQTANLGPQRSRQIWGVEVILLLRSNEIGQKASK
ncbi:hypothetical protein BH10PLA2_BH10PLA2_30170 [soil metagenome]